MAFEAQYIAEAAEMDPSNRRARSERRGKDRRQPGTRVNRVAPRRSLMKVLGALATSFSFAVFAIVVLATLMLSDPPPWTALAVSGIAVIVSIFALMLGSIEQRLIEIRLELMMTNGGMRQVDRRTGDRRGVSAEDVEPAE